MNRKPPIRITLIGMSGVGKTSIGRKLAKDLNIRFIDTDRHIERKIKTTLHEYIQKNGSDAFLELENKLVSKLYLPQDSIIATGGSVIYCKEAMAHLQKHSKIVYLKDNLEHILERIPNLETRGIVSRGNQNFKEIYEERLSLYEKAAQITIPVPYPFNSKEASEAIIKEAKIKNATSYT